MESLSPGAVWTGLPYCGPGPSPGLSPSSHGVCWPRGRPLCLPRPGVHLTDLSPVPPCCVSPPTGRLSKSDPFPSPPAKRHGHFGSSCGAVTVTQHTAPAEPWGWFLMTVEALSSVLCPFGERINKPPTQTPLCLFFIAPGKAHSGGGGAISWGFCFDSHLSMLILGRGGETEKH